MCLETKLFPREAKMKMTVYLYAIRENDLLATARGIASIASRLPNPKHQCFLIDTSPDNPLCMSVDIQADRLPTATCHISINRIGETVIRLKGSKYVGDIEVPADAEEGDILVNSMYLAMDMFATAPYTPTKN